MSTADKLASEWLWKTHSTVEKADMKNEFDKYVRIPEQRKLSMAENDILMAPVTLQEVIDAISTLNRHKDGLNNDLFKDAQALLAPAMVAISNEFLQGGTPPQSFLEELIIPLRKKGDSVDAMDYHPISLLHT
ncbi:hypothetical protein PI126_g3633 [Phytophthora idaei]|nr:hypothetical protein PI126_g3633 [Phytophthora idaei]